MAQGSYVIYYIYAYKCVYIDIYTCICVHIKLQSYISYVYIIYPYSKYIYILYNYVHIYILYNYVYIYIYSVCMHIYIYIYILYIHTILCIYIYTIDRDNWLYAAHLGQFNRSHLLRGFWILASSRSTYSPKLWRLLPGSSGGLAVKPVGLV